MKKTRTPHIPTYLRTHFHFLTPSEKWFYVCLLDICDESATCALSLRRLKNETGLAAITLSRSIDVLQRTGLIRAVATGKHGSWHITLISLTHEQAIQLSQKHEQTIKIPSSSELARVEFQVERALQAGLPATLTLGEWLVTLDYFQSQCAYCGGNYEVIEHFIPIVLGGGTTRTNCIPACNSCNAHKKDYHPSLIPFSVGMTEHITRVATYLHQWKCVDNQTHDNISDLASVHYTENR